MPLGLYLTPDELRSIAVARITDGQLPVMVPTQLSAGYGSGEQCDLCVQPIESQEVDYEVSDESLHNAWRFHIGCYFVWQLECISRRDYSHGCCHIT